MTCSGVWLTCSTDAVPPCACSLASVVYTPLVSTPVVCTPAATSVLILAAATEAGLLDALLCKLCLFPSLLPAPLLAALAAHEWTPGGGDSGGASVLCGTPTACATTCAVTCAEACAAACAAACTASCAAGCAAGCAKAPLPSAGCSVAAVTDTAGRGKAAVGTNTCAVCTGMAAPATPPDGSAPGG